MRVQHNIAAMNSYRNYNTNTSAINKNLEKLSSGYKINRAGDNAAGLAISEKMRAQITGLEVAQKNAKDGISLVQTAEGALTEVHSMLNRMFELAEQSANGTYDANLDRQQLQKEVNSLREEINRIRDSANFNGQQLFDGSISASVISTAEVSAVGTGVTIAAGTEAVVNLSSATDGKIDALNEKEFQFAIDGTTTKVTATLPSASGYTVEGPKKADGTALDVFAGQTGTWTIKKGSGDDAVTIGTVKVTFGATQTGTVKVKLGKTNGGEGKALNLQIGDTSDSWNQMAVNVGDIKTDKLGAVGAEASGDGSAPTVIDDIDITSQDTAGAALDVIKSAINYISDIRGGLGATQNRLEHTISNLSVMQENMQDAESTIRDTDVADEMMKYTKNSILVQSAQAMLAQANQQPQGVLQLLQ
jgi:flagellin